MNRLRPEYEQELADLREKMLGAQLFAEKFPMFSYRILENKWDKSFTGTLGDYYKGLYFAWGIKRWLYTDKGNITNYRGEFEPQYLFNIYINEVSLFDKYTETGLDDIDNQIDVFFYDHLNSTFYATDEQIIPLLDCLSDWYEKAKPINIEYKKELKRKQLQDQLDALL